MKRKFLALAGLALALTLGSCYETPSNSQDSSSVSSDNPISQDSATSVPDVEDKNTYGVTLLTSRYGAITASKSLAKVGESVTFTLSSVDDSKYAPYGVEIAGEEYTDLSETNQVVVKMAAGGLLVKPLFRFVLDASTVEVEATDTIITVTAIENGEYKLDDGEWQTSNVFTGVGENSDHTVSVRIASHDDLKASNEVTKSVSTIYTSYVTGFALEHLRSEDIAFAGKLSVERYIDGSYYDETIFNQQVLLSDDQYFLKSSFADDGTVQKIYDYRRGENGEALSSRLNNHNEIVTSATGEKYDGVYDNPFEDLSPDDFTKVSDYRLELNLSGSETNRITKYFTTYDAPVQKMYIDIDAGGDIEGMTLYTFYSGVSSGMTISYFEELTLDVVDSTALDFVQPLPEMHNSDLQMVFSALQGNNYTADVTVKSPYFGNDHQTIKVNPNGAIITPDAGYPYGYTQREGGLAKFDVTTDDEGLPILKEKFKYPKADQTYASLLPAFDVSTDFFAKYYSNIYTMKGESNVYDFAYDLLPDRLLDSNYISDLSSGTLAVQINADSVEIAYQFEDIHSFTGSVDILITDIGTTDLGYDLQQDYREWVDPTSWASYSKELYSLLNTYVGDPDAIPFYFDPEYGIDTFQESLSKTSMYLSTTFPSLERAKEYMDAYGQLFESNGFTKSVHDNGAIYYTKDGYTCFFTYPDNYKEERTVYLFINRV